MSKSRFERSLEAGVHRQLNTLTGRWRGTTKTWFEPDVLADESAVSGTIRAVLGGSFLMHEYQGSIDGRQLQGIAIYGFDISNSIAQAFWIDSFHMGTGTMLSKGIPTENGFNVLGQYSVPEYPTPWNWRTIAELIDEDTLIITAYNISPEGHEDKATETIYKRVI